MVMWLSAAFPVQSGKTESKMRAAKLRLIIIEELLRKAKMLMKDIPLLWK